MKLSAQAPFDPFYSDTLGVERTRQGRTLRGQFRACVFDVGLSDPLMDRDSTSSRGLVQILVPRCGDSAWLSGRPQVGDCVTIADTGKAYKVSHVAQQMGGDWELEAREV